VGSAITWTVSGGPKGSVYQFSVAQNKSGSYQIARDFSPKASFLMAPLVVGTYFVRVTVESGYGAKTSQSTSSEFSFVSRITDATPFGVVSTTDNPSVALFSVPACSKGQVKVGFAPEYSNNFQYTGSQACSGKSLNFLVAGMLPATNYQLENFTTQAGVTFPSPAINYESPDFARTFVPGSAAPGGEMIVHMMPGGIADPEAEDPIATLTDGAVVWYLKEPDLKYVWPVRMGPDPGNGVGSKIYLFGDDGQPTLAGVAAAENVLRVVDLAGNPLQETNIEDLNVQLKARGYERIYGLGHEALPLPGGRLAVIGIDERTVNGVPTRGDMVIVLDSNLQVAWAWDAFNHLDVNRNATDNDTCQRFSPFVCPVPGYPNVVDWTHANSIDYSSADGNLIVSLRNQDWVVKIDYANGKGDGHVIWRLGKGGDFKLVPLDKSDQWPWFSHQHNANFVDTGDNTIELLDDGDTRIDSNAAIGGNPVTCEGQAYCDSRGQVYRLDLKTHTATQIVNANLGVYSWAQGSAQRLPNGNYFFTAGTIDYPPAGAKDVEVNPSGKTVYSDAVYGSSEYRAWMLLTLYSPLISYMK